MDKLRITLSGKTIGGRAWDAGISPGNGNDPEAEAMSAAYKSGRSERKGKGYQRVMEVTPEVAGFFYQDLMDNWDIYKGEDAECQAWARAFRADAERIKTVLLEHGYEAKWEN